MVAKLNLIFGGVDYPAPLTRLRGVGALDTSIYISLVNPALMAVLSAAFLLLWRYQRQRTHLLVLAVAHIACGFGFLLQSFALHPGLEMVKLLSNICFGVAAGAVASAVLARTGRPVPYAALAVLIGGGLLGLGWFLFVQPDLTWRIYLMNFALGGVALVVVAELRRVPNKTAVDGMLLGLAILSAMNFFIRPLAAVALNGPYDSYEGFYASFYWTTAILAHAVISLLIAMTLIAATAVDVLGALKSESQTDGLSGLLNRRGFEDAAAEALQRAQRFGQPTALVIADLDHFKSVNDTFGHAAGDKVIMAFAAHLRAASPTAIAGRIGGEEFAVLLTSADLTAARLFAEGVRQALSGSQIEGVPEAACITASFGVVGSDGGDPLSLLLRRADDALYVAKSCGRDRVGLFDAVMRDDPQVRLIPPVLLRSV